MRIVLERPKKPGTLPWRSTCGRSDGAPRSHGCAKSAPRNTQDIKNDANLCDKKGINMTAKVMHEKRPGETPSKHEKSCWRLHGSTICTCCIAREKTRKRMPFCAKRQCPQTTKAPEKTWERQKVFDWVLRATERPRA